MVFPSSLDEGSIQEASIPLEVELIGGRHRRQRSDTAHDSGVIDIFERYSLPVFLYGARALEDYPIHRVLEFAARESFTRSPPSVRHRSAIPLEWLVEGCSRSRKSVREARRGSSKAHDGRREASMVPPEEVSNIGHAATHDAGTQLHGTVFTRLSTGPVPMDELACVRTLPSPQQASASKYPVRSQVRAARKDSKR